MYRVHRQPSTESRQKTWKTKIRESIIERISPVSVPSNKSRMVLYPARTGIRFVMEKFSHWRNDGKCRLFVANIRMALHGVGLERNPRKSSPVEVFTRPLIRPKRRTESRGTCFRRSPKKYPSFEILLQPHWRNMQRREKLFVVTVRSAYLHLWQKTVPTKIAIRMKLKLHQ